jgi:hypothetical protein
MSCPVLSCPVLSCPAPHVHLLVYYCCRQTAAVFDRSVSVFWPRQHFDIETRYSESSGWMRCPPYDAADSTTTQAQSYSNMFCADATAGKGPRSWWVGERRGCYVGVLCSGETSEDASERGDAIIQVTPAPFDIRPPERRPAYQYNYDDNDDDDDYVLRTSAADTLLLRCCIVFVVCFVQYFPGDRASIIPVSSRACATVRCHYFIFNV